MRQGECRRFSSLKLAVMVLIEIALSTGDATCDVKSKPHADYSCQIAFGAMIAPSGRNPGKRLTN